MKQCTLDNIEFVLDGIAALFALVALIWAIVVAF